MIHSLFLLPFEVSQRFFRSVIMVQLFSRLILISIETRTRTRGDSCLI